MLNQIDYDTVIRFELARTLAGRGFYRTIAYYVDGLLIDTGCAASAPELVQALDGMPLVAIANTHSHEDHIGANGRFQQQRDNLAIMAHPAALPVLAAPRKEQPLHPYRRLFFGYPEPSQARPLADGEIIETEHHRFKVIYTPGHSPDHLCFYEQEQGWLFTGDLYVGGQDRALRVDYDIRGIIASLKHVATLPLTRMFPGSARVRTEPAEALTTKIAYLEELGEQITALHEQGMSVGQIVRRACGGPMCIELMTLGHFTRRGLVNSYLRDSRYKPDRSS